MLPRLDDIVVRARECDTLTEDDIWLDPGTTLWKARRFVGSPRFYPVYQRGDRYSFAPIFLLADKRSVDVDPGFVERIEARARSGTAYYSGTATIDREIRRLGGPTPFHPTIFSPEDYAARFAGAMITDLARVEAAHPDATHVVMCGGKDSLNLLLLPWKTPPLALSAAPNYALLRAFVADNRLAIECRELRDEDRSILDLETFYNTCLSELSHCRWSGELRALAAQRGGRLILWKGQVGTFISPTWRNYMHYTDRLERVAGYLGALVVRAALRLGTRTLPEAQQRRLSDNLWIRGAMMQGTHMALLRAVCGCLVLSAYHGPAVQQVISAVDLPSAVDHDIRPRIGRILHGRAVLYPQTNPDPPGSRFRAGRSDPKTWLALARASGLAIAHDRPL
jgi:hypothetical protein